MSNSIPAFLGEQTGRLEKEGKFKRGIFRFGTLTFLIHYSLDYYKEFIEELYRIWMEEYSEDEADVEVDAELFMFLSPEAFSSTYHRRDNPVFYHNEELDWYQVRSDYVDAYIEYSNDPKTIYVPINPEGKPREPLLNFLLGVFNKILFIFGRLHIHASSITFNGKTSMFVGEKGVGKTTISLSLAKAGGIIWGEDHTMLHKNGSNFYVSGCDGIMRITKKSEEYFFKHELPGSPLLFDGVLKKQIILQDYFDSRPYQDVEIQNLFFPSVGEKFSVNSLSGREAMIYFLEKIQPRNRFANTMDMKLIIDYLGDFLNSVNIYSLELAPDLSQLELLINFFKEEHAHH